MLSPITTIKSIDKNSMLQQAGKEKVLADACYLINDTESYLFHADNFIEIMLNLLKK